MVRAQDGRELGVDECRAGRAIGLKREDTVGRERVHEALGTVHARPAGGRDGGGGHWSLGHVVGDAEALSNVQHHGHLVAVREVEHLDGRRRQRVRASAEGGSNDVRADEDGPVRAVEEENEHQTGVKSTGRRVNFTDDDEGEDAFVPPQWMRDVVSIGRGFFEGKAERLGVARLGRLTVVTWNLQLLPGVFPGQAGAARHLKRRAKRIACNLALLAKSVDVLALQEVWHQGAAEVLREALHPHFPHAHQPEEFCGLMVLSRRPQPHCAFRAFQARPLTPVINCALNIINKIGNIISKRQKNNLSKTFIK